MKRTRIKICGITDEESLLSAVEHGVDAIGFVFHPGSPREISFADAAALIRKLPAYVQPVGLVTGSDSDIFAEIKGIGLSMIQFHGDQPAEFCRQSPLPWYRAIRVAPDCSSEKIAEEIGFWKEQGSRQVLLDAWHPDKLGGTGMAFDWQKVTHDLKSDIILAGGLTPDNVVDAIGVAAPYAVDVSGGVESERGVKSHALIKSFIEQVGIADGSHS